MSNPNIPQNIQTRLFEVAMAEAMAHSKYELFSSFCDELGHYSASMMFKKLADNEKEHLEKVMEKLHILYKDDIDAMLRTSLMGELHDGNTMYPKLDDLVGETALEHPGSRNPEEGKAMHDVQSFAMYLSKIERHHTNLIKEMMHIIDPEKYPEQPHKEYWTCPHCGMIYENYDDIPEECPVCQHDRADYVLQ